jgi:hypothetical protein
MLDPLNAQDTGRRIYEGFLVHAAESTDWRDLYKFINRAAGVIAGQADCLSAGRLTPELIAQRLIDAALGYLHAHEPGSETNRLKIEDGLPVRVVKCLAALQGITADRAVLS